MTVDDLAAAVRPINATHVGDHQALAKLNQEGTIMIIHPFQPI
jgi:hypothetical protein